MNTGNTAWVLTSAALVAFMTVGLAFFYGRWQGRTPFLMPNALSNRVGSGAYTDHVENGLSVVRDRDEFFFRIRYTF